MISQAVIQTTSAKRYLGQFAKHFAHRLPVELAEDNASGKVNFGIGVCSMRADEAVLTLRVEASNEDGIVTLMDVVVRHLVRFAFREELALTWQNAG